MGDALPVRQAVRALILDPDDRLLLVKFRGGDAKTWWAMPGGGIDEGESEVDALRRELREEVGLVDVELAGPIWERTHLWPGGQRFAGQAERIYLVRCATFDPSPAMTWEQLNAEGVVDLVWWSLPELFAADEDFSPTRLPALLEELLASGPPATVIDVGV